MKLWKRAAGALKDNSSIWLASLGGGTTTSASVPFRNPPLETSIIKATSHHEDWIDYKNAQRVFAWIRTSPTNLKPLNVVLSNRINKTRSWAVALKGLILMHGVFSSNLPALHHSASRLPFNLSNFSSSDHNKYWAFDSFVRSYFAFLDHRASLACLNCSHCTCAKLDEDQPIGSELKKLVKLQNLLDLLLRVKPRDEGMRVPLVLEAMDSVVIEIFEVYSRICNGVANVLLRINTASKEEAARALKVIQKATKQGDQLTHYFQYCCQIGVLNVLECPQIEQIPEEDIKEIEKMINGGTYRNGGGSRERSCEKVEDEGTIVGEEEERGIVVVEEKSKGLKTIITEKWEVFEDPIFETKTEPSHTKKKEEDPFADFLELPKTTHCNTPDYKMPDLITF